MSNDLYRDSKTRLDTIAGDDKTYWSMLRRIAVMCPLATTDAKKFNSWCEENYGFHPLYDSEGGIMSKPNIVDPKKYMLCLLKYSG